MLEILNCKKNEFESRINGKNVICVGSGVVLQKVLKIYPFLAEKISCIVDNYKFGQNFEYAGYKIPIVSVSNIKERDENTLLVITSSKYAWDLITQLDGISVFDGVATYVPFVFLENESVEFSFNNKRDDKIPKKIHYCWFGNSKMPEQFEKNIDTWRKYCPDYEIIRWDESNYDVTKCQYMKQAYEQKKWGFVSDYARLDIINTHGGIYFDTDVEVIKSFDDLLGVDLFCGFESELYVAFGLGFGSVANNPILKEILEQYEKTIFIKEDGSLNLVTCPIYQTDVLKKHGLVCDGSYQELDGVTIFPKEFFSPYDLNGLGKVTQNTFSIHQYAATWYDEETDNNRKKDLENIKSILNRIEN